MWLKLRKEFVTLMDLVQCQKLGKLLCQRCIALWSPSYEKMWRLFWEGIKYLHVSWYNVRENLRVDHKIVLTHLKKVGYAYNKINKKLDIRATHWGTARNLMYYVLIWYEGVQQSIVTSDNFEKKIKKFGLRFYSSCFFSP